MLNLIIINNAYNMSFYFIIINRINDFIIE